MNNNQSHFIKRQRTHIFLLSFSDRNYSIFSVKFETCAQMHKSWHEVLFNINDKNNSQTLKWCEPQTTKKKKNHFEFSLELLAFKNFVHAMIFIFILVILAVIACAFAASQLFIIFHLKSKRALFTVQLIILCVFKWFFYSMLRVSILRTPYVGHQHHNSK